jgi:hypothetical protein
MDLISNKEVKVSNPQALSTQISTPSTSWEEEYDFMLDDLLIILALC